MTDTTPGSDPAIEPAEKADRLARRREIALLVMQKGRITVDEIKERFGVSGVTARADLDALSNSGELVRSHGGGIRPASSANNGASSNKEPSSDEQARLARAAVALIGPLETVMICSGGATAEMANLMKTASPQNVTVITYCLSIAARLSEASRVSLVMLGGLHRYPTGTFVGPHAEQMMKSLSAGHCFLNTPGLTEAGLTTADIMEAHLNSQMIEAASQVTVLAELKSFGHRSLALIAGFDKIDRVICDSGAPAADVAALQARGVKVVLV